MMRMRHVILIGGVILAGAAGFRICNRSDQIHVESHANSNLVSSGQPPWDSILDHLDRIVFPKVEFSNSTVEEAIDFARMRCMELDPAPDPILKGICIHINPPPRDGNDDGATSGLAVIEQPPTITYAGKNVPLALLVAEIARQANLDAYVTSTCIVICPPGIPPFPNHEQDAGEVLRTLHKCN